MKILKISVLAAIAILPGFAQEMTVKDSAWCSLRVPKTAPSGGKVTADITIKANAVNEDAVFYVDLHKFIGNLRKPGAGKAKPLAIKANEEVKHEVSFKVPEGASAVAFVCYVLPVGKTSWKDKLFSASAGVRVVAALEKRTESSEPVVTGKSSAKAHLFIMSGQSNMVAHNPSDSFIPELKKSFRGCDIVVIKDAENGQAIQRWYRNGKRDLYLRLMKKVKPAIEGKSFESVTFVWMQGESDSTPAFSGLYKESLTKLIAQLRNDLGRKDMNVVIGRISDCRKGQEHWDKIRQIQVEVAESDPLAGWVQTDDLNGDDNNMHYRDKLDRIELGRRFAHKAIELISKNQR